jgi:hypothetical protein
LMKAKPLPAPIVARYRKLQTKFGAKEFTRAQAEQVIANNKAEAAIIVTRLRKEGRLVARVDERNKRNEIYHLISQLAQTA